VYDQHGRTLLYKAKRSGAKDGLLGFTGSAVTLRSGSITYTYHQHGQTLFAKAT
jgi:hypothetical protein